MRCLEERTLENPFEPTTLIAAGLSGFVAGSAYAIEVTSLPATPTQVFTATGNLTTIGDGNTNTFHSADQADERGEGDGLALRIKR